MKYTSQSDMRFKNRIQDSGFRIQVKNPASCILASASRLRRLYLAAIILFTIHCSLFTVHCYAELIDRVVAFVDDKAITLIELEDNYMNMMKLKPDIKKEDVLNTMINRILLLREAKKLRIEAPSRDEIIQEYIDLKLKTFIRITEEDMMEFYEANRKELGKAEFDNVRDKIEEYLAEKEVNSRLKKHIEELRSKAYIKIQLNNKI